MSGNYHHCFVSILKKKVYCKKSRFFPLTHLCRVDPSILTLWTGPFPVNVVSGYFLLLLLSFYIGIPVFNANSVDPDQRPRFTASDLGLHCFPVSILRDARLKWVNPFMPNGLFYLESLDRSIYSKMLSGYFIIIPCFIEILVFNANSVDPDQTPRFAASYLGLHCFPVSLL